MIALLVNIVGLALVLFAIWWFWLAKPKKVIFDDTKLINITVKNGVYTPASLQVKKNNRVVLRFLREDPSPCAEYVSFEKLNISKQLPLNKPVDIELNISDPGEYAFTCQMGMYRGLITVVD